MEVDTVSTYESAPVPQTQGGENQIAASSGGSDSQVLEPAQSAEAKLRTNAIHFYGVDELKTSDIETYLIEHYNKPFQIEWIDDSSLNIVYEDPEDAFQSLVAITAPEEFEAPEPIAPGQLRRLKQHPSKPEVNLSARFAYEKDQKASGSRAKSRFYLLHGEPTRKEDLARFGTKRSKPMVYGYKNKDILSSRNRQDQVGDLFPGKAPTVSMDQMEDLFPHKNTKSSKRRGGRNRNKNKLPDLFADKIGGQGPRKAADDNKNKPAQGSSIFQNMDY